MKATKIPWDPNCFNRLPGRARPDRAPKLLPFSHSPEPRRQPQVRQSTSQESIASNRKPQRIAIDLPRPAYIDPDEVF